MNSREAGLVALIVALFVAFGAFTAATPTNVSAAVTDVDCDGVDETVGLTLEDGEAVDCIVQVDNDEAAVRIQPEGESENLVTLTSPDLTDIAPPPTVIVTLLQGLDSDNNPDPVQVLFEYRCVEGIEDSILIEQAGTLPFGFVRFPITCLGVNLTAPDTAENGVVTTLLVRDEDENGPLASIFSLPLAARSRSSRSDLTGYLSTALLPKVDRAASRSIPMTVTLTRLMKTFS